MRWLVAAAVACGPPAAVQVPAPVVADADAGPSADAMSAAPGVDGTLPAPETAWWIGANDREALVRVGSRTAKREYYAIADLETGCVTETHAFPVLERALETTWFRERAGKAGKPAVEMSTPELASELAALHVLVARVGARRVPGKLAWSPDGMRVLLATTDWMFRSHDGGKTLARIDATASYEPEVSADGAWGAYRRCDARSGRCVYRAAVVALDGERTPAFVGGTNVHDVRFADAAHLVTAREAGGQLCLDRVVVATGRSDAIACVPTEVRSDDVMFVSPGAKFAAVEVIDRVDQRNSGLQLYSLADGRVIRRVAGSHGAAPPVSDAGQLAWPEGSAPAWRAHVTDATGDRVAGDGDPLGWAGGRLVVRTARIGPRTGPLGNPACGLVRTL